ncbi:MAG: type II CRISPR RNA-guided endonuclease Cas9 [Paludibacteraceae bacterium]|nr:type II CRISPR RNA-guided endonuclease Cas9 [Paludibacteraceae bacterium]
MKKILGLDLGTNSIGWAVVEALVADNGELLPKSILGAGSRIIPSDKVDDFEKGNSVSQTAEKTKYKGMRTIKERKKLRRTRLNRILREIGFLPSHFDKKIDRYGNFIDFTEPKICWNVDEAGKSHFLFESSFDEMIEDFRKAQPQLLENGRKIPYDWTIFFLRRKALYQPISKEELAWVILNFNQKRGYYQLRDEGEVVEDGNEETIITAKVLEVIKREPDKKDPRKYWYGVKLENDKLKDDEYYPFAFMNDISYWVGTERDFLLNSKKLKDGSIKPILSFLPTFEEIDSMNETQKNKMYAKIKIKTEKLIEDTRKTVGEFIYDSLLQNPDVKVAGKLIRTIERKFYKDELIKILRKQSEFHSELQNRELYLQCVNLLYPNNYAHAHDISSKDFVHLFVNDIIFYQRPLKKQTLGTCPLEKHIFENKKTGERDQKHNLPCIAKSNPYFQEFRLWQFISNLKIYKREEYVDGSLKLNVDVTNKFLSSTTDYENLFNYLNNRKSIKQLVLLKEHFGLKKNSDSYRWNYIDDDKKEYPCNETRSILLKALEKAGINTEFLTFEKEMELWHLLYSVSDKEELIKALNKYACNNGFSNDFVTEFSQIKPFELTYGNFSEKAIKKLLALMRLGKHWDYDAIDVATKQRIQKLITGEADDTISDRVREKTADLKCVSDYQGLSLPIASYVVYNRHSEVATVTKWETPEDIDDYLNKFKQHSLNNPVVEQVVLETMRVVRDLWKQYGNIDEIHVELGRDMKNPKDTRKKISNANLENERTNQRIIAMLMEFKASGMAEVHPYSPSQQLLLRLYEEGALSQLEKEDKDFDFISKVSKMAEPSASEIQRYKLWLDQKYISPYTGRMIPLSKLFSSAYEIEHIIPQSRFFDDSFTNKVICESEVNSLKGSLLGYEFIKKHHDEIVTCGGESIKILSVSAYEAHVKKYFSDKKLTNLLLEDIPDKFIDRQLNDSRYISRLVKSLLSNIVRCVDENGELEQEATSKKVITCNGVITDRLKHDWGLKDVWNRLMLPRFERLNNILETDQYVAFNGEGHKIPIIPMESRKGFNIKRIDHRHHALDAIVIACTTRSHVQLLNNEAAKSENKEIKYALSHKLRRYEDVVTTRNNVTQTINVAKEFLKPWATFTTDVQSTLQDIVVSFKQNLRVVNKTNNLYQKIDAKSKKKVKVEQKGCNLAVRKSLHKETYYGEVNLRKIKTVNLSSAIQQIDRIVNKEFRLKLKELLSLNKNIKDITSYFTEKENSDVWQDINLKAIEVYYYTNETKDRYFASRKSLSTDWTADKIKKEITDTAVQKILLNYLVAKGNDPKIAFTPIGIEELNRDIALYNDGVPHKPICKVRKYEQADKFKIGEKGMAKSKQFVEGAKGTNLYFIVYLVNGERKYKTLPFYVVLAAQKEAVDKKLSFCNWEQYLDSFLKEKGYVDNDWEYQFSLSPNDLVYVPAINEIVDENNLDKSRVYKMVSSSGSDCFFVASSVSKVIVDKKEYSPLNKMERAITGEQIKKVCIPLKIDRLGNIKLKK